MSNDATDTDPVLVAENRCVHCDQPFGDDARAEALPALQAWRDWMAKKGPRTTWGNVVEAVRADQPGKHTDFTCTRVDWRERALRAEHELAKLHKKLFER